MFKNRDSCPSFIILEILEDNIRAFIYQYKEGKLNIVKKILTEEEHQGDQGDHDEHVENVEHAEHGEPEHETNAGGETETAEAVEEQE